VSYPDLVEENIASPLALARYIPRRRSASSRRTRGGRLPLRGADPVLVAMSSLWREVSNNSSSHGALGSARAIGTCRATGAAAGRAAAGRAGRAGGRP